MKRVNVCLARNFRVYEDMELLLTDEQEQRLRTALDAADGEHQDETVIALVAALVGEIEARTDARMRPSLLDSPDIGDLADDPQPNLLSLSWKG